MKVIDRAKQQKIRRTASFPLLVYDMHTNMPMGQILDMSARGMKLMSEEPADVSRVYYCRIPLEKPINGCKDICFDAECRWCRQSDETSWYNSGFILRFPSPKHAETVRKLMHTWMIDQSERLNAKYKRPPKKKRNLLQKILQP